MYLALCVEYGRDDQLIFAQQLGVEHVVMAVECWDAASLAHAKNRVEQATLTLAGLEGLSLQDAQAAQTALRATARQALLALQRVGFAGPLCAGPPPGLVGDTDWGHKGRAYDLGYLRAVLQTIESL